MVIDSFEMLQSLSALEASDSDEVTSRDEVRAPTIFILWLCPLRSVTVEDVSRLKQTSRRYKTSCLYRLCH